MVFAFVPKVEGQMLSAWQAKCVFIHKMYAHNEHTFHSQLDICIKISQNNGNIYILKLFSNNCFFEGIQS